LGPRRARYYSQHDSDWTGYHQTEKKKKKEAAIVHRRKMERQSMWGRKSGPVQVVGGVTVRKVKLTSETQEKRRVIFIY